MSGDSPAGKGDRTRTWTSPELRERWERTFGDDSLEREPTENPCQVPEGEDD